MKEWRGWIDFCKGSPGAGLFNIHASGGWAEMAGNHPCTNIGGQTFNTDLLDPYPKGCNEQSRLYEESIWVRQKALFAIGEATIPSFQEKIHRPIAYNFTTPPPTSQKTANTPQ